MTLDAAYAAFAEVDRGSLAPGKLVDYVIFDADFMDKAAPLGDILAARVRATVVDGRVAYGAI